MKPFLLKLSQRASDLVESQPLLAFFLGGALLALFLALWLRPTRVAPAVTPSLAATIYGHLLRIGWALVVVFLVASAIGVLRTCLRHSVAQFQRSHGRITEANYNAVQTIWGSEQVQADLMMTIFFEEETIERIESEDLTKPAVLRRKMVRHTVPGNPFLRARHEVTLKQNPRRKGSALYGGYETQCDFRWTLKSPAERETTGILRFPLPGHGAVLNDLVVTVNGEDMLPRAEFRDSALFLNRDLLAGEQLDVRIAFQSRGMAFWYFQVRERRAIRDFTLTLHLPDLPRARLNYPEGCMSPSSIGPARDGTGTLLTYRLDQAISHKGMGIELPKLEQPGATTNAVLGQSERGWMLLTALVILTLTFGNVAHAGLLGILFSSGVVFSYALLAEFSDLLFGFWGTAVFVLGPLLGLAAWILRRIAGGRAGTWAAWQVILFGLIFPPAAGLDPARDDLYLNLCALVLLAFTARLVAIELRPLPATPRIEPQPAQ